MHLTFTLLHAPGASLAHGVLFTALVVGTITDLRARRLPNALTFAAALCGFVLHAAFGGGAGLLASFTSFLLCFAVGFGVYSLWGGQGLGAGDIKMVMAAAALWGFWPAIWLFFASNLAMALLYLPLRWIVQGTLWANLRRLVVWLQSILVAFAGKAGLGPKGAAIVHFVPEGMEDRTPHAPFMLIGAAAVLLLSRYGALPW